MKLLLLLAAVGFTAAVYTTETSFRPGKEYIFDYETQVVTGISTASRQYSGIKIKATVRAQIVSGNKAIIKPENVRILTINDVLPIAPSEVIPIELCKEVTGEEAEVLVKHLIKPIKISYVSGIVSDIEADPSEPMVTINIKKGIISLLQVNLMAKGEIEETDPEAMDIMLENRLSRDSEVKSVFKTMEPGVEGICETIYTVVPSGTSYTSGEMIVSKIKNFKNCVEKPIWEQGIFSGITCTGACHLEKEKKDLVEVATHADYVVTGDRRNFLIKKAVLNSKYVFTPYTIEAGSIATHIKQILILVDARDIGMTLMTPPSTIVLPEGLMMSLPIPKISMGEAGLTRDIPISSGIVREEKIRQIEAVLETIVRKTVPVMDIEVPSLITKLVIAIRDCTPEEIETIVERMVIPNIRSTVSDEMYKKKEIIMDILPTIPTPAVVPSIVRLIKKGVITGIRAGITVNLLTLTAPATPEVIIMLLPLIEEPMIRADPQLHRAVVLGIGTIIHKLVVIEKKAGKPISPMSIPTVHRVIQTIRRILATTTDIKEKVTIIKAIGNSGVAEFLTDLKVIALDKATPKIIRVHAIYACRRIAPIFKWKVQSIVTPVMMDPTEHQDLRIASFVVLMDTQPSYAIMQVVAHTLRKETNLQVGSFIYSYMRTVAQAKHPALRTVARNCRLALLVAKPVTPGMLYSKAIHMDIYKDILNIGGGIDLFIEQSPMSILPKAIVTKLNAAIMGKSVNAIELGISTEGLETIVRRLMGPLGILKDIIKSKSTIADILSPIPSPIMGTIERELKTILSKLDITTRTMAEPIIDMYVKVLGNELRFLTLDTTTIKELISKVESKLPEISRILREGINVNIIKALAVVDNAVVLPTPVGLPLSLNLTVSSITHITGIVKVEGVPSIRELITGRMPSTITVIAKGRPTVAIEMKGHMGIDATVLRTGAGVKGRIYVHTPVDIKATIDTISKKLVTSIKLPDRPSIEDKKIVIVEIKPISYVQIVPVRPTPEVYIEIEKEIMDPSVVSVIPLKKIIPSPLLAHNIIVEGVISKRLPITAAYHPLAGKIKVVLRAEPISSVPKEIRVKVAYGSSLTSISSLIDTLDVMPVGGEEKRGWWSSMWGIEDSVESREIRRESYRSSSRMTTAEFLPVTTDSSIVSPIKNKVIVAVETVGSGITEVLKSKITLISSPDLLTHQVNVQVIGAPIIKISPIVGISTYDEMIKVAVDTVVDIRKIIYPTMSPIDDLIAKVEILGGSSNIRENKIIMKVKAITKDMMPMGCEHYSPMVSTLMSRPDIPVYIYTADIEVDGITPVVKDVVINYMISPLKSIFHRYITVKSMVDISPAANKIVVIAKVLPTLKKVSVIVNTPTEKDMLIDVPIRLPFWTPSTASVDTPTIYTPLLGASKHVKKVVKPISKRLHGECKVIDKKVITFDKVAYTIPKAISPECEVVLAKDCSSSGIFTLLAMIPKSTPSVKVIKLLIPKVKVEVVPIGGDVIVKVNGIEKKISTGKSAVIKEIETDPKSPVIAEIVKVAPAKVVIDSKKLGIKIVMDKDVIIVEVGPTYKGLTCGLCGDFNGEVAGEYKGKKMTVLSDVVKFVADYLVPSSTCKPEEVISTTIVESIGTGVSSSECAVREMNVIRSRVVDGMKEICLSISPIPVCSDMCDSVGIISIGVPFHCLPANEISTGRLIADSKIRVLYELENMPIDTYMEVITPADCKPMY